MGHVNATGFGDCLLRKDRIEERWRNLLVWRVMIVKRYIICHVMLTVYVNLDLQLTARNDWRRRSPYT